jgi:endonuclease/exonuclease/phosphatase family metal-dependent hydrolase
MNLANGGAHPSGVEALIGALDPDILAAQELAPEQASVIGRLLPFGRLDPARNGTGMGLALRDPARVWRLPMPGRDAYIADVALPDPTGRATGLEVINVHLAAPHVPPLWRTLAHRRAQLRVLSAHLDAARRPRAVVGDLNSTPAWPAYRRLRSRLADAAAEAAQRLAVRPARTWGPTPRGPRLFRIDHALVHDVVVGHVGVQRIPGSDHCALLVDLTANPNGDAARR